MIAELKKRPYDTIVGTMDLQHADPREQLAGRAVAERRVLRHRAREPAGARKAVVPKPAWKLTPLSLTARV